MHRHTHFRTCLVVLLAAMGISLGHGRIAAAGNAQGKIRADESARLALRYAEALTAGRIDDWARLDLGCLGRLRNAATGSQATRSQIARTCYDDTINAYRAMIEDTSEPGVLGPTTRGRGLGLLSETHRHASLWKDYPPALFLSPAAVRSSLKTPPTVELRTVSRHVPLPSVWEPPHPRQSAAHWSNWPSRTLIPSPPLLLWRRMKSGGPADRLAAISRFTVSSSGWSSPVICAASATPKIVP